MKKKHIKLAIFSILLLLATVFAFYKLAQRHEDENIFEVNLREHKNLAMHIHPFLEIEINGQKYTIPANIGISAKGMQVIHTHDATGKLHIESPYQYQFYLKDFFTIWGKSLNSSCIFEYCEDSRHNLTFYVDGAVSAQRESIPLKDGEMIKIVYK